MDETSARTDGPTAGSAAGRTDLIDRRSKALIALGLALLGALGGGVIAHAVQAIALLGAFAVVARQDYLFVVLIQGLAVIGLGVVAILLGRAAAAVLDEVATPVGRTAVVLGSIAVAGGLVTTLIGILEHT